MSVMYIDLETLPDSASVGMTLDRPPSWVCPRFTGTQKPVAKNLKDAGKIEAAEQKNFAAYMSAMDAHEGNAAAAAMGEYRKRSFSPLTGRIACIGYAIDNGDPQVIQCDEDEEDGLRTLMDVHFSRNVHTVIAHNGAGFDFDWMFKRLLLIDHPHARKFYQAKPWDTDLQDTLVAWRGSNKRAKGSMDAICEFFGWSRADNPIRGGEVFDRYVAGDMAAIVQHCREDVVDLRRLALKLELS